MVSPSPSQAELDLRRRARRRLVGVAALALVAVVVLPMLFDPEPKPLGNTVEIKIPEPSASFDAPPGSVPAQSAPPLPDVPETVPEAATEAPPPRPEPTPPVPAEAREEKATVKPVAPAKDAGGAKIPAASRETAKVEQDVTPVAGKVEKTKEASVEGAYLQLGAFSSEANARKLLESLRAAGFAASIARFGGQYKVRSGPYASSGQALEMQAKLKAKGFSPVLLGP